MNLGGLTNPVWERADNLRDPAVLPVPGGYRLFYSRYSNGGWGRPENWAVAGVFTPDFAHYEDDRDLTPKGFASPGDPVRWRGRYILPYQRYPLAPAHLCYSESDDARRWSEPRGFLEEATRLPWNTYGRAIDPALVVEGDALHCFFVGSCGTESGRHANLLGHAVTRDPELRTWKILTPEQPLIGRSERAPDGVENVTIFREGDGWTMIYSEGLAEQHLASAWSQDLTHWEIRGPVPIAKQSWMERRHGAPFVWRDGEGWRMILMGEAGDGRTRFGLLLSADGVQWTPLPTRPAQ